MESVEAFSHLGYGLIAFLVQADGAFNLTLTSRHSIDKPGHSLRVCSSVVGRQEFHSSVKLMHPGQLN